MRDRSPTSTPTTHPARRSTTKRRTRSSPKSSKSAVSTDSEADVPEPGPGQVLIDVRAAAVNPLDLKIRSGRVGEMIPVRFPMIPGYDAAGVVDPLGRTGPPSRGRRNTSST
ncbi:alcohol dehydrogenase catalytic domain-containing protein [Streptomyces sp. NPDC001914]|uniref:alcohol dehydrogenase catalytic domain-containing protein n=1 Tax=Streptomyces sp. NPDC001914 TaxID=3364623 RepID=UPI00369E20CF